MTVASESVQHNAVKGGCIMCAKLRSTGAEFFCLEAQKFKGVWVAAGPLPPWKTWQSHWICTITTSATGLRWGCGPPTLRRPWRCSPLWPFWPTDRQC